MRNLSDVETARLVYFGCFHGLMSYGILLWGNAADIHRIFVLQKRTVRAIYKLGPRASLRNKFCMLYRAINGDSGSSAVERREDPGPVPHPPPSHHRYENSVFSGLSSDIQNDLIKSIAQVIRDEIKSEINFAKFVSVIADETPDISHREQMSVIFRYLTKTGIEERFVGFFDVTLERGADQLSQSILEVIDQFNCKEKLVGQSYDGAAVMSGAQGGVQTKIKLQCPMAVFIPCYAHVLNLVLSRSLENIP
ncbi:Zinc finger MYM-type protein 1 [Eumeta japonica]|uniref:Zinc finger MYM-type protein 1 n=1 Tax=Eumeta variegata TaxID=151549 RepID=A0A4C1XQC2_EUMVA|nr:Zinc finger MYM-type protein 1 [Eumeta japonica]